MRDLTKLLPLSFRVLLRVFLLRVIDLELLSADSDTTKLIGQFAGLFAAFSLVISLPFLLFGLPRTLPPTSWTMQHFLFATTMLVTGLFSVLTWDSIFPDRRDVLVLGPLPVRASTLFGAKMVALLAAVGLVIVSLNAVSGVVFPLMFFRMDSGLFGIVQCLVAFWITTCAAGIFLFCCIVLIQGCAAQLLPRQVFLRASALLQASLFCVFVAVYFLEPPLESVDALTAPENQRLLACLPAYWFLGMFHALNGSLHPAMVPLARRAWVALAGGVAGAGGVVMLSYFRVMRTVVEQPDIVPRSRFGRGMPRVGGSVKTALLLFSARALLRSRQHRVLLSFYFGVGFAAVIGMVRTAVLDRVHGTGVSPKMIEPDFLAASMLMMFLGFFGLRIVSAIPITLRANWIFQVTQVGRSSATLRAVRLCWLLLGVAPVWLVSTALLLRVSPWQQVGKHAVLLGLIGLLLVELGLQSFRKIPFTCSYLPGKGNLHLLFWVALGLVLPALTTASRWESRELVHPSGFLAMAAGLSVLLAVARLAPWKGPATEERLMFEEEELGELISLKLN